uniref:(northern house mosquito) hypothetical protein n=1 Tax=Culex pipiens TaxID=7175 RepID=A0A8D8G073_CULPI
MEDRELPDTTLNVVMLLLVAGSWRTSIQYKTLSLLILALLRTNSTTTVSRLSTRPARAVLAIHLTRLGPNRCSRNRLSTWTASESELSRFVLVNQSSSLSHWWVLPSLPSNGSVAVLRFRKLPEFRLIRTVSKPCSVWRRATVLTLIPTRSRLPTSMAKTSKNSKLLWLIVLSLQGMCLLWKLLKIQLRSTGTLLKTMVVQKSRDTALNTKSSHRTTGRWCTVLFLVARIQSSI